MGISASLDGVGHSYRIMHKKPAWDEIQAELLQSSKRLSRRDVEKRMEEYVKRVSEKVTEKYLLALSPLSCYNSLKIKSVGDREEFYVNFPTKHRTAICRI